MTFGEPLPNMGKPEIWLK